MGKRKSQESESWLDFGIYDYIEIEDINIWDNRLRIDPIHGMEIKDKSDLIGFLMFLQDGNPFEYLDSSDIFY